MRQWPADPKAGCVALRAEYPQWEISYECSENSLRGPFFAWRSHPAGRSGVDASSAGHLAAGIEMYEALHLPWS